MKLPEVGASRIRRMCMNQAFTYNIAKHAMWVGCARSSLNWGKRVAARKYAEFAREALKEALECGA